jgi:dTDP-N-acetylfucosamine:lipid II N-acetylfucosaminyltransferase
MSKKILHVCNLDKFIPPFINFIEKNYNFKDHEFRLTGDKSLYNFNEHDNVYHSKQSYLSLIKLAIAMNKSKKIILHNLGNDRIVALLWLMPWLLKKTCWVLWGRDLYQYIDFSNRKFEFSSIYFKDTLCEYFRRFVICRLGFISTTVPGDYKFAVKFYKTRAKYIENLMYSSHLCRTLSPEKSPKKIDNNLNIQVGNSADPQNKHLEVFDKLVAYDLENVKVYCPLSYGNEGNYAEKVIQYGKKCFGDKFVPMLKMMSMLEYDQYLSSIDIALFNHSYQQGMGNMIAALSLGKKVYINSFTTPYEYFINLGLYVYKTDDKIDLSTMHKDKAESNIRAIESFFTEQMLINSWTKVFNA